MKDKPELDAIIKKISDIALLEMQIRSQMNEILAVNRFLRSENERLRGIIAASKHTRMALIAGGLTEGKIDGNKNERNTDEGPSNEPA